MKKTNLLFVIMIFAALNCIVVGYAEITRLGQPEHVVVVTEVVQTVVVEVPVTAAATPIPPAQAMETAPAEMIDKRIVHVYKYHDGWAAVYDGLCVDSSRGLWVNPSAYVTDEHEDWYHHDPDAPDKHFRLVMSDGHVIIDGRTLSEGYRIQTGDCSGYLPGVLFYPNPDGD